MIIANDKSHKENLHPKTRKMPRLHKGLVVPEREIISLVGNLLVKDLDSFAQRMHLIVETTCETVFALNLKENETLTKDRLSESDLQTLKRVAREDKSEPFQRVMKAIIEAVKQGPEGIRAANRTAGFGVKVAFGWSQDYYCALWEYESGLFRRRHEEKKRAGKRRGDESRRGRRS
jgi:hypothetical protein